MSGKTKINIHKNMTRSELDNEIHNYFSHYKYYLRLIAMKIISSEGSIKPAADLSNVI